MSRFQSEFLNVLAQRGFIHQVSDEVGLDALFQKKTVTGYIGFDPTAGSLHAGSLLQIMILYWMQQTGHRPIILMGGGTGLVGDPSFKDEARQLLTAEVLQNNMEKMKVVFSQFIIFGDGPGDAIIVNNADWLCQLNYLEFLRDVGRHFSVNRMLAFESVKQRLEREQSLSFLEFNYMILQAYDFVELNKRFGTKLQMGGSDQWGNIINGIDLGHRMLGEQLYALTTPLLSTSSGAKMGKTHSGAIWINADATSPYEFWQYWRNTDDADVSQFLKLYTSLPLDEIDKLSALGGVEINEAKKILATEVTRHLHGDQAANLAAKTAQETFEQGVVAQNLPLCQISVEKYGNVIGLHTLLVEAGFANSNSEARRHIQAGAVRINDKSVHDKQLTIDIENLADSANFKLSLGKKKHVRVISR